MLRLLKVSGVEPKEIQQFLWCFYKITTDLTGLLTKL